MERQLTPDDPVLDRRYRTVRVTIEVRVMSEDEQEAEILAWDEVEKAGKAEGWKVTKAESWE